MNDFLIIGGGVIGMMTAWQLADTGHEVTLIERGQCGREASWAGGGIVSPLYPWRHPASISQLSRWSESYYPTLAERLLTETGIDPEYRQKGLLYLRVEDEAEAIEWARQMDKPLARVDAGFLYDKESNLAPGFKDALWMPTLGSIRNPRLGQALRARLHSLPKVIVQEGVEVKGLEYRNDQVLVKTQADSLSAAQIVLCGGAWTGQLLKTLGLELPIHPVKGQMMVFKTPAMADGRLLIERVVLASGRYLIPRADGRVLVGSTLEHADFDKQPTEQARASLHESAIAMLPALANCEVEHHWAGLRPGSPGGVPFIGPVPGIKGLFINAGHYRNGLVLAPAATRLLVDQLLGQTPILDPAPYHVESMKRV